MRAAVMDSVVGGRDDRETFERAQRAGFLGVEIVLARDELRSPRHERLATLRRAKEAGSLAIPSLVLGEHSEGGLASPSAGVAADAAADVRTAIQWAAELGADVILVPFFSRNEVVTEADFDRCVEAFRELCPASLEAGVTLCFEGTLAADRLHALAQRIGSAGFGCYFDLGNAVSLGLDAPTEIRELGALVHRVHLKDARVTRGDCRPGLGLVDFAESARALREIGYDGWLVHETPPGPLELVMRDLSFARSVFPTLRPEAAWPRLGAFSRGFSTGEAPRLAETFAGLGLEAVQLEGDLLADALDDADAGESTRAELAQRGITVAAVAGYRNLVAPDAAARRENIAFIARCLEAAPVLGTSIVATQSGTRNPENDWADSADNWGEEAWGLLVGALEELLTVAERAGAILALEGHVNTVLGTTGQAIGLFERFPSEHLQLVCDPYNYLSRRLLPAQSRVTGDLLDRFEHRWVVAHAKDVGPEGAEVSTPEFGTGVSEQRPYLEFLRGRRPDLPLVLEHLPLEHVPEAIERIRTAARRG